MKRFLQWWKGQPVLGISLLAALVSMCFVPPDAGYLSYCNRAVLIQLFCLMLTVAGLRSIGVFEQVTQNLLKRAGTVRRVGMFLVQLCFFSAMLVTNDVALLTFVPLTLLLFQEIGDEKSRIWVIVLETAAANLGSMMTPVGNPQNLYLYAAYQLHTADFFRTMLPAGVLSWLILLGLSFLLPKTPCAGKPVETASSAIPKKPAAVYLLLFLACLLHELGHLAMLLLFHRHVQTVSLCGAGALFVPSAACGAYWQDILVSLAGPAVNLLLGTAFLWGDRGSVSGMLHLGLGLFNLLPYARLDGGAVCRSVFSVCGCLPEQTERLQNGIAVLLTVLLGTVCWQFRLQNLPFCLMCVYLLWIQLWESHA